MEQENKILIKVRKLLALAADPNASEGEIENALKMAESLMMKHNIDQKDIHLHKSDINFVELNQNTTGHERANWIWNLCDIVSEGYNCRIFRRQVYNEVTRKIEDVYKTVGFTEDRMIVKEIVLKMIEIIRNLYRKRWNEYQKQKGRKCRRVFIGSYVEGFLSGLNDRLQDQRREILKLDSDAQKWELIVLQKDTLIQGFVDEVIKPKNVKLRSADVDLNAYLQGIADGSQDNLSNQIEHQKG